MVAVAVGAALAAPSRATASGEPECPPRLECRVVPAQTVPGDPGSYGNYDLAGRPADGLAIRSIVIHDTEYLHDPTIALFQDPEAGVSAHYVVRSADGRVTQMVPTAYVPWHAGNWWVNTHAIGIEIEGYALEGPAWYTPAVYRSLARLIRYLAARFDIPLDRAHVIGHDEVPGPTAARQAAMHWDPGPFFDWARLMRLAGGRPAGGRRRSRAVTIAPRFAGNFPALTTCEGGPCRPLPAQPANVVALHTAPSESSPLVGDPLLTGAGPGTTRAEDWGSKAVAGQTFAAAGREDDWTAIWFGGQKAWFHDPDGANSARGRGTLVTPRRGLDSVPVYGRAYPAAVSTDTLGYTIPAGQVYVAYDLVGADYYEARLFDAPQTYRVVRGDERYYAIAFNHRHAFVRADDVEVVAGR